MRRTVVGWVGRLRILGAGAGIGLGSLIAPALGAQERLDDPVGVWKAGLTRMQGGVWMTSNAEYVEEDQGMERFGMEVRVQPGGLSATACLWSERADGTLQVAWQFLQGWDPVRRAGFVHQSHWSGGAGFGYLVEDGASGEPELIQDFWWPDGTTFRTRHTERWQGPDVRVSASEDWAGDRWVPRRTYTWIRELGHPSPCS